MKKKTAKTYAVTGVTVHGKRFSLLFDNLFHAMHINLFRGSVWEVVNGKRKLLKRVYN